MIYLLVIIKICLNRNEIKAQKENLIVLIIKIRFIHTLSLLLYADGYVIFGYDSIGKRVNMIDFDSIGKVIKRIVVDENIK